jgi:hypothetical protein
MNQAGGDDAMPRRNVGRFAGTPDERELDPTSARRGTDPKHRIEIGPLAAAIAAVASGRDATRATAVRLRADGEEDGEYARPLRARFKGSRPYKQKADGPISSQPMAAEAQSAASLVGVWVAA